MKPILFNGRTTRIFHAEAEEFHPATRVEIPGGEECVLSDTWDRRYFVLSDDKAIEVVIEVSEAILTTNTREAKSKHAQACHNLIRWREETSVEKIREITLATPRAHTGKMVFEGGEWPAVWILTRDLTKDERLVVLAAAKAVTGTDLATNAPGASVLPDWMTREETQAYCKIGKSTLTNWMRREWIRFHKKGHKVLFNRIEVDEDLKQMSK